jgi:hypothetical protein
MKPEVIGNPLLRGIIVKEGWDGILQNLGVAEDVDGELIAVDGRSFIEGSGRKLTSLAYITAAIKPLTDDYEMGILKDGMHDFHQAYCKKWDMLRQTASEYSGDAKPSMKEYMAAFARQKHLLVIQRYESPVDIANETTDIHYNVSDFGIRRLLSDVVGGVYINLEETNTPKEIAKKLDAQFKAASKAVSGADLDADERERRKSLENAEFAEIRRMIEAADERDRNMDLEPNYEQKQLFADISTLFANPELFVSLSKAWSDNSPQKTG